MIKFTANQMVDVLRQLESVNLRSVLEDVAKESYNSIINNLKEAIGKQEPQSDQVRTKGILTERYTFFNRKTQEDSKFWIDLCIYFMFDQIKLKWFNS